MRLPVALRDRAGSIGKALKAAKTLSLAGAGSAALESSLDSCTPVFLLCGLVLMGKEKLVRAIGVEGGERLMSTLFRTE